MKTSLQPQIKLTKQPFKRINKRSVWPLKTVTMKGAEKLINRGLIENLSQCSRRPRAHRGRASGTNTEEVMRMLCTNA